MTANTDIRYLKGVGAKRAEILKGKGIDTVGALLRFFPRKYLDWTDITPVKDALPNQNVCIKAKIVTPIETVETRRGITLYKFIASDKTDRFAVTLFNQRFLAEKLKYGCEYLFYGKFDENLILRQMNSPIIKEVSFNRIEPIYNASKNMPSATIQKLVKTALDTTEMPEVLNSKIRTENRLCDINYALRNIHFPKTKEAFETAKKRLVFEELFTLQVALSVLKTKSHALSGCVIKKNCFSEFQKMLPFELTVAQKRVVEECICDMRSGRPMSRLVQGDVGSGKTAVAAALCFVAAKNGYQSALMAPTEILAEQHYKTFCSILKNTGINCALLTGALTQKQKTLAKNQLKNGEIDVIIGTHALIVNDVEFNNLGLVITDEQHRFGVAQRGKLAEKGKNPHTLVMSATPIPQTLAYILYGDLDISIIDMYPKGRQKIDTYCVDSTYRQRIYNYIKKFLNQGRQGYIVCPLVEENEESDLTSATEYYEDLSKNDFKYYSLGLLHGKMKPAEKEEVMQKFARGVIQLLISTTVIEVGIDVPNAVIMVIENAERFGLSQLHQLRGRIGRGEFKSDCILISDSNSHETKKRLDIIKQNSDGFKIADYDLNLRGPGDFLGNRQHGIPEMRIADIFADKNVLITAKKYAEYLLTEDPTLSSPENKPLKDEVKEIYKKLTKG
ncbi:MAG: ATP-dependent DNA helicase RecG [Acutalibacteraceae bacterium]|nr:ATP-dependent DNA helicase RecG [Acutalibacteraceae bacterium]